MIVPNSHWEFEDDFDPEEYFGFVYLIENKVDGRKYIGRKNFFSTQRKKVLNRKNRKTITKESDWRSYCSSCKELKLDISEIGKENFNFIILSLHLSKGDLNYSEVEEQVARDVLTRRLPCGKKMYYNNNIMSKFFARESWEDLRNRRWVNRKHEELFVCKEEYESLLQQGWKPGRKNHNKYFYARQCGKRNTIFKAIANGNHPTLGKGHSTEAKAKIGLASKRRIENMDDNQKRLAAKRAKRQMSGTKNHKFKPWAYKAPSKDWVEVHDITIKAFCASQGKYKVKISSWVKPTDKRNTWHGWDFKFLTMESSSYADSND